MYLVFKKKFAPDFRGGGVLYIYIKTVCKQLIVKND